MIIERIDLLESGHWWAVDTKGKYAWRIVAWAHVRDHDGQTLTVVPLSGFMLRWKEVDIDNTVQSYDDLIVAYLDPDEALFRLLEDGWADVCPNCGTAREFSIDWGNDGSSMSAGIYNGTTRHRCQEQV